MSASKYKGCKAKQLLRMFCKAYPKFSFKVKNVHCKSISSSPYRKDAVVDWKEVKDEDRVAKYKILLYINGSRSIHASRESSHFIYSSLCSTSLDDVYEDVLKHLLDEGYRRVLKMRVKFNLEKDAVAYVEEAFKVLESESIMEILLAVRGDS